MPMLELGYWPGLHRLSRLRGYALAMLAVAVAILLALFLLWGLPSTLPGQVSSPLLLLAVAISAGYGGNGPGLFAAGLALVCLEYLFLPPIYALGIDWTDTPRFGAFLGAACVVSRLTAKRLAAESALHRTEAKLQAARMIQQRLMPSGPPNLPGVDIAGASFPADTVGGDYFDFLPLRDDNLGIVVADVSGHGLGPALLMAVTRAYLRALALTHDNIGEILTSLNRLLVEDTGEEFVTLFFASLDLRRGCFTYAGAGHEAYLLEPSGAVQRLCSTSIPLGLKKDLVVPCAARIPLVAGQVFLLATDGLSEMRSPQGELFGIERTLEVVRTTRDQPAQQIIDSLHKEMQRFSHGHLQEDDITVVALIIQAACPISDRG